MSESSPPRSAARQTLRACFDRYTLLDGVRDEFFAEPGRPWPAFEGIIDSLGRPTVSELRTRQAMADAAFRTGGITFSVYSDQRGVEKIFPFDLVPRPIARAEWARVERGLQQRVQALNAFIGDVYGAQHCFRDQVIPREMVVGALGYLKEVQGVRAPGSVWTHIAGIDLVRDAQGTFRVLEDNLRCPSGVSYVLENRAVMKRVFPHAFADAPVASVDEYPVRLLETLRRCAPDGPSDHPPVVLTPGPYNSAYFEHSFLARRLGIELVQGSDLVVVDDRVFVKTTRGPRRVDTIYRRIDDAFLDPRTFRPDSLLGVPGLFGAWARGNVTLANAPGNGVADDKAIYPWVPDLVRYYLGEDPLLEQVPTWICARPDECAHVLANLETLVVKAVDEAGGYGMLFGPASTAAERATFAEAVRAHPRRYIAQPIVELSTCPVWNGREMVARRVDLRPYVLCAPGRDPWVLPGGLTRVALREGSYVVNSSQGGGSKDTWVLTEDVPSRGER